MGLILATDDVVGINLRVRDGDPTVGWRGDPNAVTYFNESTNEVEVHLTDLHGHRYVAAATPIIHQGWRHDLLRRLRDGDWQRGAESYERIIRAQHQRDREDAAQMDEMSDELTEKMAWAIRKDLGSKEYF